MRSVGAMMSVDETLMCSFQILKPPDKIKGTTGGGRPNTPSTAKVINFGNFDFAYIDCY